jgi:hypothetical protein
MIDSRQEDRSKETDRRGTSWMCVCDAAFYTGMTNLSHFFGCAAAPDSPTAADCTTEKLTAKADHLTSEPFRKLQPPSSAASSALP